MKESLALKREKVKKHSEAEALLIWYDRHRRVLPWRAGRGEKPDPYRVWLSEIMLQQTTVVTVGPYFMKFVDRWPTLDKLASAKLDDVLRMWAGLGYYRRARLLHECARKVRDDFKGIFPNDEKTLQSLPGFGPYTAAAVATIAFDKKANVVDGNVERVMSRLFVIDTPLPKAKPELRARAATLLPEKRCGDYAQALMDLGATVCTPRSPKCSLCPWNKICQAKAEGIQETLPRRIKKKTKPVRRAVAFVLMNEKGDVFLRRRPSKGLLAKMMEVPSSPWKEGAMPTLADARCFAPVAGQWKPCGVVRHVFTHFTLEIAVMTATAKKKIRGHWVPREKLKNEALPSLMRKIIGHAPKTSHS
ncbi:MAG: A/G-specific adenine glycosylase [Bdellovibrionales bacterium]